MQWDRGFRSIDDNGNAIDLMVGPMPPQRAAELKPEPREWVCIGDDTGMACGDHNEGLYITAANGGGPHVQAWAWSNVPAETDVVRFTDHDGTVSWQRPIDGFVMFQDTQNGNEECNGCQLDAFDASGNHLTGFDLDTLIPSG